LYLGATAFGEPGGECHGSGVQVEVGGRQVRQGVRPEPGSGGQEVEHESGFAIQPAIGASADPCGGEQLAEFVGGQFAPSAADIPGRVHEGERFERVRADPFRLHEPAEETTSSANVVVGRFRRAPLGLVHHEGFDRRTGECTGLAVSGRIQVQPFHRGANSSPRDSEQLRHVARFE
jgi:hypothetical protein